MRHIGNWKWIICTKSISSIKKQKRCELMGGRRLLCCHGDHCLLQSIETLSSRDSVMFGATPSATPTATPLSLPIQDNDEVNIWTIINYFCSFLFFYTVDICRIIGWRFETEMDQDINQTATAILHNTHWLNDTEHNKLSLIIIIIEYNKTYVHN